MERLEERDGGIRTWDGIVFHNFGQHSHGLADFHHRHNRIDFEVSSLFSNLISVLGLPFVSLLAVIFFHDAMDGLKAAAILLALWGFASYLYQHYLDDPNCNAENNHIAENQCVEEISLIPLLKEVSD